MKYLIRFSKEHPNLPHAELESVCESQDQICKINEYQGFSLLETDSPDLLSLDRLAYTMSASEYLGSSDNLEELAGDVYDYISDVESFKVNANFETTRKLGDYLTKMGLKVKINKPEVEVTIYQGGGKFYAGLKIALHRNYERRKPQNRPFFHPTSMHPKLARALVNLSKVREGEILLDPFCGTGGILIEAGLVGAKPLGWDVDQKMVSGCRANLRFYNLEGELMVKDALKDKTKPDAIVTDPPYGRGSYATGEIAELYLRFIKNARKMLEKDCILVIMAPNKHEIEHQGFDLENTFDIRVHKSLTRRIWVLKST